MAPWTSANVMMIAVAVASIAVYGPVLASGASTHTVGGLTGWRIPPNSSFYSEWAAGETFAVGDTLMFNFPSNQHQVVTVPKSGYDGCSSQNQIGSTITTSPATITLDSAGDHYYLCGIVGHCDAGQKLAVSVSSSPSSAGSTPTPTAGDTSASGPTSAVPGSDGGHSNAGFRTAAGSSVGVAVAAVMASLFF